MSEFLDREAILSEGSEDEDVREELRRLKHKKLKHRQKRTDSDSDEEEEEDDDEKIANEMKDLINDDIEEEEEDSEDEIGRGHKRSREEEEFDQDLEEDDYDLIEENLGRKIERKKKFRRVRRLDDDDDDDEPIGNNIADREMLANELFEDDDGFNHSTQQNRSNMRDNMIDDQFGNIDSEHSESEEIDDNDFIVDDNDQPIMSKPKKKSDRYTDQALQQAQDIFGVDFDFDILDENEELDDDEEDLEEDDYGEDGYEDVRVREGGRKKRQRMPKKSIFELYEPAELERSHLTEADNDIRNTDLPERFQLRSIPIQPCDMNEIREESEWIFKNLYEIPTVTKQDKSSGIRQPLAGSKPKSAILNIQQVLHFLRVDFLEVPFIAYYRKEYYLPELSINDLWLIYRWDEKWCQLQERKRNLQKLLENMKEYQLSLLIKSNLQRQQQPQQDGDDNNHNNDDDDIDRPLPNDFRRITERDIKRIQTIQSFEEFNDYYSQFQLYYFHDLNDMKKHLLEQKREAKERKRMAKEQRQQRRRQQTMENSNDPNDPDRINNNSNNNEDDMMNNNDNNNDNSMRNNNSDDYLDAGDEEQEEEEEEEDDVDAEEMELSERLHFMRIAMKRDTYSICREFNIGRLASKYGLTPEQFGEHISEGYNKYDIEQNELDPLEAAKEFISKRFDTEEKVLQAATYMVGRQLSCDPLVRKIVRQTFYERATVNVRPTKKGKKEIDESHPCYSLKYLRNKPISSFIGDQYLQLNLAKNEGLVEIEIFTDDQSAINSSNIKINNNINNINDIDNQQKSRIHFVQYLDEIKHLYQRDEFSKNVQNWNEQRTKALEIALNRFLYPYLLKELTTKVLTEAQFSIIQSCSEKLASFLAVKPYIPYFPKPRQRDDDDEEEEVEMIEDFDHTRTGTRIMGLAFTPTNEEASYCALIDGDGEVTDYLKLEHFMLKRGEGFLSDKERNLRKNDREKIKKFILTKKPHVIALGTETIVTRDVMDDLQALVREIQDDQFPLIPVEYVDSELSVVFTNSKRANADFHNYPLKLRQAISLARRLQDPLNEFVQLCSADEEILCLKLHPLQDHLPREQLLNAVYAEFINRVNEVGVDINKCLVHPYLTPLVQFIGGLGPRKGSYLLRQLKKQQTPLLESRTQLVQNCNIGKVVFINCAGFIKIDTNSFSDSGTDTYIEVLDSTRVHPEAYEWARKMAVDALDYDEDNDTNPAQALEEIIENPEKLRDLDLDEFAKELKRQGLGLKKQTLYDIRTELSDRYADRRKPYRSPNEEEIFELLTGENLTTFHAGKLVQVRVTRIVRRKPKTEQVDQAQPIRCDTGLWKCPFCMKDDFSELGEVWNHFDTNQCPGQASGVGVRLDNGLNGIIPLKYLSDKDVVDPLTRVKIGMTINCRILKVLVERFSLELTCRTSDLIDANNRFKLPKDNYYDFESEERDVRSEEETKRRKSRQRTYMKRIIVHPSFHNIDFKKSEQILSNSPQGEAVIRPSSKGNDHLTLSWKVHDNIHQHVSIKEKNKTNAFSLGRQLFIDQESFEDLDEIIARYIQPMAGFARDMINFKYFRDLNGDRIAAEKVLSEEKQKAPSRIPYIISASKDFPGKFLLSYQPNQKAFHEFITVTPDGFKYRNITFKSINALFKWFKNHFNDRSTFPRTPGPSTPILNASPYIQHHQRTPDTSISPFVGSGGGGGAGGGIGVGIGTTTAASKPPSTGTAAGPGFVPTPNINPQAIQRAVASMPNHVFNTLSQVASAPQISTSAAVAAAAAAAAFHMPSRPNLYVPPPPPLPNAMSSVPSATAAAAAAAAGVGSFTGQSLSLASAAGPGPMPPPPPPIPVMNSSSGGSSSRPGSRSGNQWSDMLKQDWPPQQQQPRRMGATNAINANNANISGGGNNSLSQQQQQQQKPPRTPVYATPGASSQMSISPIQEEPPTPHFKGDQTPLVDEWN